MGLTPDWGGKIARYQIDANGNTVLVGGSGRTYAIGGETLYIGNGGQYIDLLEASTYLRSLTVADWLTPLVDSTCTIANGSKMITLSGGSLWTNDIVRPGDQWSADGANFYTVRQVIGNTRVYLETPYLGATISSLSPCTFYRPKFRGVYLLPGDHDRLDLQGESVPAYVHLSAAPGAVMVGSDPAGAIRGLITVPRQGIVDVVGVVGRSAKNLPVFVGSSDSISNAEGTCLVRSIGSDLRTMNVDYFQPAGMIGRFEMINSIGSFAQDGCLPVAADTTIIRGSHLFGENTYSGVGYWHLRMFAGINGYGVNVENSTLEMRHDNTTEPVVASMFFDLDNAGSYTVKNSSLVMTTAGNANKMYVATNDGGTAGQAALSFSNCSLKGSFASGTPTIVAPLVWTGTASVTAKNCDMEGFAVGGGGVLTPDIVAAKFNVL